MEPKKRMSAVLSVTVYIELEYNTSAAFDDAIATLTRDGPPHTWQACSVGWEASKLKGRTTVRRARK